MARVGGAGRLHCCPGTPCFGPLPRFQCAGKKSEAEIRRLSGFLGGPLGMLWPTTGPGTLGRGRHKTPQPVNPVVGICFGGQDFLLRRSCRYASQANSSAPEKAIAPVINRVVFVGCAPGCRGPASRSRIDVGRPGRGVTARAFFGVLGEVVHSCLHTRRRCFVFSVITIYGGGRSCLSGR